MHNMIRCIKRNVMMLVEVCHIERCWKSYINRIVYVKLKLILWSLRQKYINLGVRITIFLVVLTKPYGLYNSLGLDSGSGKEAKLFDQHRVLKNNKWPRPRFFQGGVLITDPAAVERARSHDLLGIVINLYYLEILCETWYFLVKYYFNNLKRLKF